MARRLLQIPNGLTAQSFVEACEAISSVEGAECLQACPARAAEMVTTFACRDGSDSYSDSNSDGWPCYTEAECICENHGFNMTQCESMACCQWGEDAVGGQCWADNERCGSDGLSDDSEQWSDASDSSLSDSNR
jgi:hypothetical protein